MKPIALGLGIAALACGTAQAQPPAHPQVRPGATAAAPPAVAPAPVAPVATARIMMLRWFTGDIARAEAFYRIVFGMTTVQRMGDNVRIMVFPGGVTPGLILIQSNDPNRLRGSFIVQVADVQATLATAAANGGKLLNTKFGQDILGQRASSSHFEDPDGNVIEVLQIGGPRK